MQRVTFKQSETCIYTYSCTLSLVNGYFSLLEKQNASFNRNVMRLLPFDQRLPLKVMLKPCLSSENRLWHSL